AYMEQHRADWGLPGMTLCLADASGFTMTIASGLADVDKKIPVDSRQLFQVGSISKMMTALTLWSLIDERKLAPDALVRDLLPGLVIRDGAGVTVQHLLDHVSGLPGGPPLFSEQGLWSGSTPGSHWTYSNAGYSIAGMIAARVGGAPFPELVERRVLKPIGMNSSVGGLFARDRARHAQGYQPTFLDRVSPRPAPLSTAPWVDSDSAAGCVAATTDDMARFLQFLLRLSRGKGAPVFSDRTARRFLADPVEGWGPNARYGNGIARITVDGRKLLHHTGGMVGFSSALHVDPAAGVAAFASSNVSYLLGYRPRDVTIQALRLMRARGATAPAPAPTKAIVQNPERYVGAYAAADRAGFEIAADGDALVLKRGGATSVFQPAGDLFATTDPLFPLGLAFDLDGETATRAWALDKEFRRDGKGPFAPRPPERLARLAGRYDNDDPWQGSIFIVARDGALYLNNTDRLIELRENEYRIGAEIWSPERVEFSSFIAGRPEILRLSGSPFQRRFG
ncbi:MAG: serine hydrolase, partial [Parvularculaceae bacterium]|nr:serine hydrolase [Parvularculaceae bacterium]